MSVDIRAHVVYYSAMKHEDIVTISEFIRKPKAFLDASKSGPVYVRRGLEIFKLEAVKATFKVDESFIGPNDPRQEAVDIPWAPQTTDAPFNMPSQTFPGKTDLPKSGSVRYVDTDNWGA